MSVDVGLSTGNSHPPTYDVCFQTQHMKPTRKFVSTVLKMASICSTTMIRISRWNMLKFRSKAHLKKLGNLGLSLRTWPWRFQSWLRELDSLKLASRCLRNTDAKEQRAATTGQEIMKMIAMRRSWRRRKGLCLARLQCFISAKHLQEILHRHLYCWPDDQNYMLTIQEQVPSP